MCLENMFPVVLSVHEDVCLCFSARARVCVDLYTYTFILPLCAIMFLYCRHRLVSLKSVCPPG